MESFDIAPAYPGVGYDGEPTFTGVLRRYFVSFDSFGKNSGISKNWNDETKATFIQDYNRRILPAISALFGKEKPLHSYTEEEFEQVLEHLKEQHHYAENTMFHYRHLLWVVYRAGFENGLYDDNIFWDDIADPAEETETDREERRSNIMTRLRKSFSIDEELRIIRWFKALDPKTALGEELGLLLMFFEGLRNNEACGANFGSIHPLKAYESVHVFDMLQSTRVDSNEVKGGGKTGNAPRVLPLFEPLYDFLMKRRAFLAEKIASGELTLPPNIGNVDQLPIVCVQNEYTVRASARKLTACGRTFFYKIGIDKSELALLHQILFSQEFREMQIDEKEPTTYLMRRNCATHLYQLGFSEAEIQYWMGHDIEDPFLSRNSFADEDTIFRLAMMAREHPLYAFFAPLSTESAKLGTEDFFRKLPSPVAYTVESSEPAQFLIDLTADEPRQPIWVHIDSQGSPFRLSADTAVSDRDYPRTADIKARQKETYCSHVRRRGS